MVHKAPRGIWTISGPSAAGKTTLIASILTKVPHARPLRRIVTRAPRQNDTPGAYEYLSTETFMAQKARCEFLWPVQIHGTWNGVRYADVSTALQPDRLTTVDFAPVNVEKLVAYVRVHSAETRIKSIYLDVADEGELRQRMQERGETHQDTRISDSRPWREDALRSFVPFHFVDALMRPEEVLSQALAFFLAD